jgi:chromosome segregation ATPase
LETGCIANAVSQIYNEQPRDLLLSDSVSISERPNVQIREDAKGRIYVEGLKSVPVNTIEELLSVLNHGSTIRQTDATAINERSSRSHAVFTLTLNQRRPTNATSTTSKRGSVSVDMMTNGDSVTTESKLHFVDLAGSERMKNTGATGDRAKEGISINAGLASLGKVISQLSSRSSGTYVSYRDSKLTRMLQDSLGGNAITYMIACVTPAEFHLSETLNTVQYAQRARNIQSKPKIQQISDEGDKQATIERLRTEIAFLRQQIRSAEGTGDHRNGGSPEVSGRSKEREAELQNHLLDVQESYTSLSQRHAKLISELTKSSDKGEQLTSLTSESAMHRMKRSHAHQQQIEEVVLEYEKTIQSLEANLSTTRAMLANTESSLMEKETKCAFIETLNQQLHSRVQKLMDRENNTEQYLRGLEARVDGQDEGGNKDSLVIEELRKELARIREGEVTNEDYISNLEERLAEADQDIELMQREVERLEHVVERQRSLGKLDNLLYELDHVQHEGSKSQVSIAARPNGVSRDSVALEVLEEAKETELPDEDADEEELSRTPPHYEKSLHEEGGDDGLEALQKASPSAVRLTSDDVAQSGLSTLAARQRGDGLHSPAQSRFVADKFEAVSQELFDLRLDHESTVNELDLMTAKYQETLRILARMQDVADEARHPVPSEIASPGQVSRPSSFLEDARIQDQRNGGRLSSSRSLSSELSLAGESHASTEPSEVTPVSNEKSAGSTEVAYREIERLQQLLGDHESNMKSISDQYAQLLVEHQETLATVEQLKTDNLRSKALPPPPSPSVPGPGMIRRMGSHPHSGVTDRGNRSVVSLRNIMAENFDGEPDKFESAEVHLNAAAQELSNRKERIEHLEAELKNSRKEMEMKSSIITGLTRERNSLKGGSPVDLAMVGQMRDQLIKKETELKAMHEGYAQREQDLLNEMQALSDAKAKHEALVIQHEGRVRELEGQVDTLKSKQTNLSSTANHHDKQLSTTKAELEAALASVVTLKAQQSSNGGEDSPSDRAAAVSAMQTERDNYQGLVEKLKRDTEQLHTENAMHIEKIKLLEQDHAAARDLVDSHASEIEAKSAEIAQHKSHIEQLKAEIQVKESAVEFHKHGLRSLHEAHANQLEEMKLSHAGAMAEIDEQLTELAQKNQSVLSAHKADLNSVKAQLTDLMAGAQLALGHPTSPDMLVNHIQDVIEEKKHVAETNSRLVRTNAELERQLEGRQSLTELEEEMKTANTKIANYQETIRNLANEVANHEESLREKTEIIRKRDASIETLNTEAEKKLTLIEELEQQLQRSFDQHHKRVSVITAQGSQALAEAQQRISVLEKDLEVRRSFVESDRGADSRSNTMKSTNRPISPKGERTSSITSALRKSNSVASLPSPPPSVPLPPLPALPGISVTAGAPPVNSGNPSPPSSRHTSKEVSSLATGSVVPSSPKFQAGHAPPTPTTTARDSRQIDDLETRLRTIEKHLHAEKQLTATLEEALVDLEAQQNTVRADMEGWKKKAWTLEEELGSLRKERRSERLSVQVVEEEKRKRMESEAARAHLEERMRVLSQDRKKKKGKATLNCF